MNASDELRAEHSSVESLEDIYLQVVKEDEKQEGNLHEHLR